MIPVNRRRSIAWAHSTWSVCDEACSPRSSGSAAPASRRKTRRNALASAYFTRIFLDVIEGLLEPSLGEPNLRQLQIAEVLRSENQAAFARHALGPAFLLARERNQFGDGLVAIEHQHALALAHHPQVLAQMRLQLGDLCGLHGHII